MRYRMYMMQIHAFSRAASMATFPLLTNHAINPMETTLIYAIAHLEVTNPEKLAAYRDKADAALARHGGKVETATQDMTVLDGVPVIPKVAALLSFPDRDAAIAWAEDPDLQTTHALRRSSGKSDILLLG